MKRALLLLAAALPLLAQYNGHVFSVLPDSTRTNVGYVEFLDKEATPGTIKLQAPAVVSTSFALTLPPSIPTGGGCWFTPSTGLTVIDPTCGGSVGMTLNTAQTVTGVKTFSASVLLGAANTYDIGSVTADARNIFGRILSTTDLLIGAQAGPNYTTHWDIVGTGTSINVLDNSGNSFLNLIGAGGTSGPAAVLTGDLRPSATSAYYLGSPTTRWAIEYSNAIDTLGSISMNGTVTGCTNCVTSVTASLPLSSSGGTTPAITCATCVATSATNTFTAAQTFSASVLFGAANTYSVGSVTADAQNIFGRIVSTTDLLIGAQAGPNYTTHWDIVGAGTSINILDNSGNSFLNLIGAGGTSGPAAVLTGDLRPSATSAYYLGSPTTRWAIEYSNAIDTMGSITMNGTVTGCTNCVTSVTASGPLASSGGTTPAITCATCVATSTANTFTAAQTFSATITIANNQSINALDTGSIPRQIFKLGSSNDLVFGGTAGINNIYFYNGSSPALTIAASSMNATFAAGVAMSGALTGCTNCVTTSASNTFTGTQTFNAAVTHGASIIFSAANTYSIGSTSADAQNIFGRIVSTTDLLIGAQAGPNYSTHWDIVGSGTSINVLDNSGNSFLNLIGTGGTSGPAAVLKGDLRPSATSSYYLGSATTRWAIVYSNAMDTLGSITMNGTVTGCTNCVVTSAANTYSATQTFSSGISVSASSSNDITIGSTGNFYTRPVPGSGISCSGVGDGWFAIDKSGANLMFCAGGARYKVAGVSY